MLLHTPVPVASITSRDVTNLSGVNRNETVVVRDGADLEGD